MSAEGRIVQVLHHTSYRYAAPVAQSWQLAHLAPRDLPRQRVRAHRLSVDPVPDWIDDRTDYFGNAVTTFAIHAAHASLDVVAESLVEVAPPVPDSDAAMRPWDAGLALGAEGAAGAGSLGSGGERDVDGERNVEGERNVDGDEHGNGHDHGDGRAARTRRTGATGATGADLLELAQYLGPSPQVPRSRRAVQYARRSFEAGVPFVVALCGLAQRIHRDFEFDPTATTVTTPIEEVFDHRRGVCQDFAQVMIAGLRGIGVPARYVSGYIITRPPPGKPKLVGADASHAWVSAWCPGQGWIDVDPTNDRRIDQDFVTLGWGRDFSDVTPLRGVILGGGAQKLEARVTVTPIASEPPQASLPAGHRPR